APGRPARAPAHRRRGSCRVRSRAPRHPDADPPVHPRGTEACGPQAPQPSRGIDPGRRDVAPGGGCGAGTDPPALTPVCALVPDRGLTGPARAVVRAALVLLTLLLTAL